MRRVAVLTGAVGLGLILGAQPALAQSAYAGADRWTPAQCGQVTGDGSVTYTWNAGHHLAPTSQPIPRATTVTDIDAVGVNRVLAVTHMGRLSASDDAGCTWAEVATVEGQGPFSITPAPDGSAYVWTKFVDNRLYRVTGSRVMELPAPAEGMLALVADPQDAAHLRVVTGQGTVLDSRDGGLRFQKLGTAPAAPGGGTVSLYDAAIAPTDLDRVVLGTVVDGAYASTDGGRTWARAALGGPGHRVNVFTVTVSPADPAVVWAMGLDITEMDSGARNEGRHIFRSTDGGQTFRPVVDHVPGEVTLTNGLLLVPHPVDRDQVYFEFGSWFFNYGTDLFTYDARLGQLKSTHNGYDDVSAIAFNPRFPELMYLGLSEVR